MSGGGGGSGGQESRVRSSFGAAAWAASCVRLGARRGEGSAGRECGSFGRKLVCPVWQVSRAERRDTGAEQPSGWQKLRIEHERRPKPEDSWPGCPVERSFGRSKRQLATIATSGHSSSAPAAAASQRVSDGQQALSLILCLGRQLVA